MNNHKNNSNNVDNKLNKLLELAELNEKRWEQNEKRWEKNEKRWEMLAVYIRKNEEGKKALMQKIDHTLNNFRGWIREQ